MEQTDFQNISHRYFRGNLSEEEYSELTGLLKEPHFRELFETAKAEWSENPELNQQGQHNWNRLQFRIHHGEQKETTAPLTRRIWLQVAAAAAILIIGLIGGGVLNPFNTPAPVFSEQLVFETPRGEKSLVRLPDGTQVNLNANSRLVYHSFTSNRREVELKGEAFFNVTRNENAPFIVKTNECDIEVLGTTFNVMAYDEFGRKEITLLSGKVNVNMENSKQQLLPGQALILRDNQTQIIEANTLQAAGWVDNKFNFNNIPLSELIKRLENWYDVDIQLNNPTGREVNFTGTFKNEETIWQVLDAIKIYTPIEYQKTELRTIKITVK